MSTPTHRQGFTLIELLVVISIIAILAGMLLPAINMVRSQAQQANCGNNQRQIVMAMLAYRNDNDDLWPGMYTSSATAADRTKPNSGDTAAYTTMLSFEFLSSNLGGELSAKTFACPSNAAVKPSTSNSAPATVTWVAGTPASKWVTDLAATSTNVQAYAYDFATPSNAASSRAVVGDRPIDEAASATSVTNHKKKAVIGFADGHYETVNIATYTPTGTPTYTSSQKKTALTAASAAVNKNVGTDENVYDNGGIPADNDSYAFNSGNSSRAWLK